MPLERLAFVSRGNHSAQRAAPGLGAADSDEPPAYAVDYPTPVQGG
ncbi:hypothetical protein trd_A0124 (plasmid) [Thermomicrobium roseum DSM 5159]|uniref:Uncharacterized protein n=1 Tax=Thermomicrobium roseum (strain ATCC 27502 / DSM 5159 / P-2) TaxID=309801 RepID=B9L2W0_THERP|nr:hypothetical protein trd_A0124 [Thermomicrobium roseum DSM 5159]